MEEIEIDKKLQFIYDNINKVEDHRNYIELLSNNNCTYTTNSNGIFVNLRKLNEKINHIFYLNLNNELSKKINIDDKYEKEIDDLEKNKEIIQPKEEKIKYGIIPIDDFNNEDQEIIEYSKKYNL